MQTKMETRNDVEVYLKLQSQLNDDINLFREKWKMFYFGFINGFKIFNLSKEDFLFFADKFPQQKFSTRQNLLMLQVGQLNGATLELHTEIDFELYQKYVLKNNLKTL